MDKILEASMLCDPCSSLHFDEHVVGEDLQNKHDEHMVGKSLQINMFSVILHSQRSLTILKKNIKSSLKQKPKYHTKILSFER